MAYTSLRKLYAPLTSVPGDLRELYERMRPGYGRTLLSLLLECPARMEIGTYRWQTGLVYLPVGRSLPWFLNGGLSETITIEYAALWRAVISLGRILAYHRSPYGVWKSSESGHGEPRHGRLGGYRYTRNQVPFEIGLVDRRKRLRGAVGNGR